MDPLCRVSPKEVKRLDAKRLHWKAEIPGRDTEWGAEITEQLADQRLALTIPDVAIKGMVAIFHELSNDRSTVRLQVEYNPQSAVDPVGDALGMCICESREIWSDLRDSLKSVGSSQAPRQSSITSPCKRTKQSEGYNSP